MENEPEYVSDYATEFFSVPKDLNLSEPDNYDNPVSLEIKEHLDNITDFGERLAYYNKNVRSLSTFLMDGEIFLEWGEPKQKIKIFCGCLHCRKNADFEVEHLETYFEQRDKEVKRMVEAIGKAKTYENKLKVLFSTPGYHPNGNPIVYANNYTLKPRIDGVNPIWFTKPIIDLRPTIKNEFLVYNSFVIAASNRKYMDGAGFSKNYKGFDFKKQEDRLEKELKSEKICRRIEIIRGLIEKIKTDYNLPVIKLSEEERKEVKKQNKLIGSLGINLFARLEGKLVEYRTIIFDQFAISTSTYFEYINILQVILFYEHLQSLEKVYDAPEDEVVLVNKNVNVNDLASKFDFASQVAAIGNAENKFIKSLPMDVVVSHFLVLTTRKSKNGLTFLTNEQFVSFIKRSFLNDEGQPIQRFNCTNTEKGFIISRFHELFVIATSQYYYPSKISAFVSIIEECFSNWEKGTVKDLFKPNKTKQKW